MRPFVGIAIPNPGTIRKRTVECLIHMLNACEIEWRMLLHSGSLVSSIRCRQAEDALMYGCTHLLFIDSDMTFPTDLADRLAAHNLPIVAANCTTRKHPVDFNSEYPDDDGVLQRMPTLEEDTGVRQVYRTGTGVMMIQCDVFTRIEKPWFSIGWNPDSQKPLGEDYFFCKRVFDMDIPIFVDMDLSKEIGHLGEYEYTWRDRAG